MKHAVTIGNMTKNIKQTVEKLLREYVSTRDSDKELLLGWLHIHGMIREDGMIHKNAIREMPILESLTRARRELQQENPFLRGQNYQKRQTREQQVREFYRQK